METSKDCCVQVAAHARPLIPSDGPNAQTAVEVCEEQKQITLLNKVYQYDHVFDGNKSNTGHIYKQAVAPLVENLFKGYNATVACYGQTGSGKTHTMGSDGKAGIIPYAVTTIFALLAHCLHDVTVRVSFVEVYKDKLYDLLAPLGKSSSSNNDNNSSTLSQAPSSLRTPRGGKTPAAGVACRSSTSTSTTSGRAGRTLLPCLGGMLDSVTLADASQHVVTRPEQVLELLRYGAQLRRTADNGQNVRSSRSHAVFTITLEQTPRSSAAPGADGEGGAANGQNVASPAPPAAVVEASGISLCFDEPSRGADVVDGGADQGDREGEEPQLGLAELLTSSIHFVDLAGSEKHMDCKDKDEMLNINRSLLTFERVLQILAAGESAHVPYRESLLTRLLKESLGGNSRTLMIACISPAWVVRMQSASTLKYAEYASKIRNKPRINRKSLAQVNLELADQLTELQQKNRELLAQLLALRKQLQGKGPAPAGGDSCDNSDTYSDAGQGGYKQMYEELLLQQEVISQQLQLKGYELEEAAQQLEEARQAGQQQAAAADQQVVAAQSSAAEWQQQQEALLQQVAALSAQLGQQLAAAQPGLQQQQADWERAVQQLQQLCPGTQLAPLEDPVGGSSFWQQQQQEDGVEAAVEVLQCVQELVQGLLQQLQSAQGSRCNDLAALQQQLQEHQARAAAQQQAAAAAEQQRREAEAALAEARAQHTSSYEQVLGRLEDRAAQLQAAQAALKQQTTAGEGTVRELQQQLADQGEQLHAAQAALRQQQQDAQAAATQAQQQQEVVRQQLQEEQEQLRQKMAAAAASRAATEHKMQALLHQQKQQVADKDSLLAAAATQQQQLRRQLEEKERQLQQSADQQRQVQQQLEERGQQIADGARQLQQVQQQLDRQAVAEQQAQQELQAAGAAGAALQELCQRLQGALVGYAERQQAAAGQLQQLRVQLEAAHRQRLTFVKDELHALNVECHSWTHLEIFKSPRLAGTPEDAQGGLAAEASLGSSCGMGELEHRVVRLGEGLLAQQQQASPATQPGTAAQHLQAPEEEQGLEGAGAATAGSTGGEQEEVAAGELPDDDMMEPGECLSPVFGGPGMFPSSDMQLEEEISPPASPSAATAEGAPGSMACKGSEADQLSSSPQEGDRVPVQLRVKQVEAVLQQQRAAATPGSSGASSPAARAINGMDGQYPILPSRHSRGVHYTPGTLRTPPQNRGADSSTADVHSPAAGTADAAEAPTPAPGDTVDTGAASRPAAVSTNAARPAVNKLPLGELSSRGAPAPGAQSARAALPSPVCGNTPRHQPQTVPTTPVASPVPAGTLTPAGSQKDRQSISPAPLLTRLMSNLKLPAWRGRARSGQHTPGGPASPVDLTMEDSPAVQQSRPVSEDPGPQVTGAGAAGRLIGSNPSLPTLAAPQQQQQNRHFTGYQTPGRAHNTAQAGAAKGPLTEQLPDVGHTHPVPESSSHDNGDGGISRRPGSARPSRRRKKADQSNSSSSSRSTQQWPQQNTPEVSAEQMLQVLDIVGHPVNRPHMKEYLTGKYMGGVLWVGANKLKHELAQDVLAWHAVHVQPQVLLGPEALRCSGSSTSSSLGASGSLHSLQRSREFVDLSRDEPADSAAPLDVRAAGERPAPPQTPHQRYMQAARELQQQQQQVPAEGGADRDVPPSTRHPAGTGGAPVRVVGAGSLFSQGRAHPPATDQVHRQQQQQQQGSQGVQATLLKMGTAMRQIAPAAAAHQATSAAAAAPVQASKPSTAADVAAAAAAVMTAGRAAGGGQGMIPPGVVRAAQLQARATRR